MSDSEPHARWSIDMEMALNNKSKSARRIYIELAKHCYTTSASFETTLQTYSYFTEAPVLFVRFLEF
jgi:hypothetical protein